MSFKALRETQRLSQERVAAMTGLSLRTVQRLEAGHRVGYASLRALAVTFQMDVDVLERTLYAAPAHSGQVDFVELPRWVRRLRGGLAGGGRWPARRQAQVFEAMAMGLGLACGLGSLAADAALARTTLQVAAGVALCVGYGVSLATRVVDAHAGWQPVAAADTATTRAVPVGYRLALYLAAPLLAVAFLWAVVRLAG